MIDLVQLFDLARAEHEVAAQLSLLQHQIRELLQRDDVESWAPADLQHLAGMIREARQFAEGQPIAAPAGSAPRKPFPCVDIDSIHRRK